jgi:hypothetical protein
MDQVAEGSRQLALSDDRRPSVHLDLIDELVRHPPRTRDRVEIHRVDESPQQGIRVGVRLPTPLDPGESAAPYDADLHVATPTPVHAFFTASVSVAAGP